MKKIAKITASVLAFAMVLTMTPAKNADAAKKVNVKKVTVQSSITGDSKNLVIAKGKTVKLATNINVTPNKAANKKVTYKSVDTKVATVNKKGVVKGISVGKTKVTVTSVKNQKKKASINIKVVKGAVKKVSFAKKSATLDIDKKLMLKAKVTAQKGADKTVGWKSSNEAVATVNNRGVVTAVGSGTATITATAADGSGKKATCKVTVPDKIGIATMRILNPHTIKFTLSGYQALTMQDVTVNIKTYYKGIYCDSANIKSLTMTDNHEYTIVLADNEYINEGDCVKVECLALKGKNYCEDIYTIMDVAYASEKISSWTVNKYGSEVFSFEGANGHSALSMANLPQGLTYVNKGDYIVVKGTPLVPGVVTATFKASDEWGNSLTETVKFIVGSETSIVAAATETYYMSGQTSLEGAMQKVYAAGGSGNYHFSVISDPSNIVENKNDSGDLIELSESDGMSADVAFRAVIPGRYEVTVRATDVKNAKLYADVVMYINVAQSITVSGCIKDETGRGITDAYIIFENADRANRYCDVQYAYVDSNGMYSAKIVPGTYNILASNGSLLELLSGKEKHFAYDKQFNSDTTYDVSLPLRRVEITEPALDELLDTISWYCDGEYVGMGRMLYMKQGTYVLEATAEDTLISNGQYFIFTYEYTANVTVTATNVTVKVDKVETSRVRVSGR